MLGDGAGVAEECWRSSIPVQLQLADNEVSSLETPPVLFFLVPRHGYLHSLVAQALPLLQHLLPPGEHVPWFEHGRLPLKWGVPAGVLYDLVAGPSGELPWRLTLHFRGFPDRQLPAYGGEGALRGAFFNSLKEASHICRGSAQRVMEMAAGAQEELWRQVLAGSLQRYREILGPLQLAPAPGRGRSMPTVPLRLYVRRSAGFLSSYEDIAWTSRPVPALGPDGSPVTLRQALLPLLEEFVQGAAPEAGQAAGAGGGAGVASPRSPAAMASDSQEQQQQQEQQEQQSPRGGTTADAPGGDGSADAGGAGEEADDGQEGGLASAGPSQGDEAAASGVAGQLPGEASAGEADGEGGGGEAGGAGAGAGGEAAAASPKAARASADAAAGAQDAGAAGTCQTAAASVAAADALDAAAAANGVLVCGAAPPLESPLAWLHAQMHSGDYFLYVVLHLDRQPAPL